MTSSYLPLLQAHIVGYVAEAVECFRVDENKRVDERIVSELFRLADECVACISGNTIKSEFWFRSYKDGYKEFCRSIFWEPAANAATPALKSTGIIDQEQMRLVRKNQPAYYNEWGIVDDFER